MKVRHVTAVAVAVAVSSALANLSALAQDRRRDPVSRASTRTATVRSMEPPAPEVVSLGKQLFFDPRLSGDNTMSCATCHLPDKAFTDGRSRGQGRGGKLLARNTPTLLDVVYQPRLMWDGRANSLEEQALLPIQSPDEMHQDLRALEHELNAVPGYRVQFQTAFDMDATAEGIAKAIAAFERTLVTKPSPHDRFLAGEVDALSPAGKRGRELFFGDARVCALP